MTVEEIIVEVVNEIFNEHVEDDVERIRREIEQDKAQFARGERPDPEKLQEDIDRIDKDFEELWAFLKAL